MKVLTIGYTSLHIQNKLNIHVYTSKFLLTSYKGLIWSSTAEAIASWSTTEGALRAGCNYCMYRTHVTVAAAYPKSILNGTPNMQ